MFKIIDAYEIAAVLRKAGFLAAQTSGSRVRGYRTTDRAGYRATTAQNTVVTVRHYGLRNETHEQEEASLAKYQAALERAGYTVERVHWSPYTLAVRLEKKEEEARND